MINPLSTYRLFRSLLKARAEIKALNQQIGTLTMTRDELLQKVETVRQMAVALRSERDALAKQVSELQASQDFSDVGAKVDGITVALQPQPADVAVQQ